MQLQWRTSLEVESKRQTLGSQQHLPVWNDTGHQTVEYAACLPYQTKFQRPRCQKTFHLQLVTSYCITDDKQKINTHTSANALTIIHGIAVSLQKLNRQTIIFLMHLSVLTNCISCAAVVINNIHTCIGNHLTAWVTWFPLKSLKWLFSSQITWCPNKSNHALPYKISSKLLPLQMGITHPDVTGRHTHVVLTAGR